MIDPATGMLVSTAIGTGLGLYTGHKQRKAQQEMNAEQRAQDHKQTLNDIEKLRLSTFLPNQGQGIDKSQYTRPQAVTSPWETGLQGAAAGFSQGMEINNMQNQQNLLKQKTAESELNMLKTRKELGISLEGTGKDLKKIGEMSAAQPKSNYSYSSPGLNPQGKSLMNKQLPQMESARFAERSLWDNYEGRTLDPGLVGRANQQNVEDTQRGYTIGAPRDPRDPVSGSPWEQFYTQYDQHNRRR